MKLFIMGNHDYWLSDFVKCWEIPFKGKMRRRMEKYTGESPWLSLIHIWKHPARHTAAGTPGLCN